MALVPSLPDNAPFSAEQRAWLNGFLAGLFSRQAAPGSSATPAPTLAPLTVLFGSQTGTAEGLAKRVAKEAGKRGFAATVVDLAQVDLPRLAQEKAVLLLTSTYGDGEPPDNAKALWSALAGPEVPSLASVRYSVCALGDTNYAQFCRCGRDFDERLEKHGAVRVAPRVDCDLDYEETFTRWLDASLTALAPSGASVVAATASPAVEGAASSSPEYTRQNPFPARLLTSFKLNGEGSAKAVHHIEFSLAGSGLSYEAGDALGVYPQNCPDLVNEVLAAVGFDGEEAVEVPKVGALPLRSALLAHYDLGRPSPELLASVPVPAGAGGAASLPQVIDVLRAHPDLRRTPAQFLAPLKRLQPRLYSISSSPKAHPDEVHLTVGAVRYTLAERLRKGVCSTYLAERAVPGSTSIGVFLHRNAAFRPPANPETPMIMVGPGTGIAPFRAFLEERAAIGAKGRNWLFFGDQHAATDFLYQDQLRAWQASGLLTRLDTAFSRDQAAKVYVQDRMREQAAELYAWLEAGAHFYVCGDAARMAKDVDRALHEAIALAGGKTPEAAADYVRQLQAQKRYARDVY